MCLMCLVVSGEPMPVQDAATLQKAQWVSVGLYMLWLEESVYSGCNWFVGNK
jgi:hypothetical protein